MTEKIRTILSENGTSITIGLTIILVLLGVAFGGAVAKIQNLEEEADKHVTKELFDSRIQDVIKRLERIEHKLDEK